MKKSPRLKRHRLPTASGYGSFMIEGADQRYRQSNDESVQRKTVVFNDDYDANV